MKALLSSRYNEIIPKHDELFLQDCYDYIRTHKEEEQRPE